MTSFTQGHTWNTSTPCFRVQGLSFACSRSTKSMKISIEGCIEYWISRVVSHEFLEYFEFSVLIIVSSSSSRQRLRQPNQRAPHAWDFSTLWGYHGNIVCRDAPLTWLTRVRIWNTSTSRFTGQGLRFACPQSIKSNKISIEGCIEIEIQSSVSHGLPVNLHLNM